MAVRVACSTFDHVRRFLEDAQESLSVELPEHATVAGLLDCLGITWGAVGIIQVNGHPGDEASVLSDGDHVEVFAPIGGGQDSADEAGVQARAVGGLNPLRRVWLRLVARVLELTTSVISGPVDISWITGSLAVGGSFQARDLRRLISEGVDAVVDLREEAADDAQALAQRGIEWCHLPTPDTRALSQEQLAQGVEWVRGWMARGKRVLVHCEHGVGRSPLLACAVLVSQGFSAPAALEAVRAKRWQAAPNDRQLEALLAFEARWRIREGRGEPGMGGS